MVHSLNFAWMSVVRSNQVAYLSSIKTPFRILTAGHSPRKNPNVRQKNHWSNWSFLSFRKGNIGKKGVNFSRYWPPIQILTPLTQDVDWAYIRRSEGVLEGCNLSQWERYIYISYISYIRYIYKDTYRNLCNLFTSNFSEGYPGLPQITKKESCDTAVNG